MRLIDEFLTVFRNLVRQTVVTARNGLPLGSGAQQNISRNFRQEIAASVSAAMELWIARASNLPVPSRRAMMERCESGDANARSGTRR
jgi:hypothetical protein